LLPKWERALREFWERHADAEQPLRAWYHDVLHTDWKTPADVKRLYASVSIVGENRLVFNVGGNKYRIVVAVNYKYRMCYVRFVGTHQAYDRIDVAPV
jgi:mRNA interferase HigB